MKVNVRNKRPLSTISVQIPAYTQILYIPPHLQYILLEGKPVPIYYPNGAQPGFITSGPNSRGDYFCRYWMISDDKLLQELRTKHNSESVKPQWLWFHPSFTLQVMERTRSYINGTNKG